MCKDTQPEYQLQNWNSQIKDINNQTYQLFKYWKTSVDNLQLVQLSISNYRIEVNSLVQDCPY